MKPLQIIGCGPGARDYLTGGGLQAALQCDCLLGPLHLLKMFKEYNGPRITSLARAVDAVAQIEALRIRHRTIGVLVSGDTGLYSLATPIIEHFGLEQCTVHPGISSVQLAFARLGLPWEGARILSAHAQLPQNIAPTDWDSQSLGVVLAGTESAVQWCAQWAQQLGPRWKVTACSDLALPEESIRVIDQWEGIAFSSRTLFIFQKRPLC